MEPRPVTQSEKPKYPTRRDVLTAAAVLAVAGVTGSLMVPGRDQGGEGSGAGHKTGGTAADKTGAAGVAQGKLLVAPLFVHGTGRGAVGCVVTSPPAFLSEEEGAQTIREELATHGVELKPGGTLAGVSVPHRSIGSSEVKGAKYVAGVGWVVTGSTSEPLHLGGVDNAKKVAMVFLCADNYARMGGALDDGSSAWGYDFSETAAYVGDLARKQGKGPMFLGIFYDPALCPNGWVTLGELGKPRTKESRKLLRLQATDFVAWLKKQGGV